MQIHSSSVWQKDAFRADGGSHLPRGDSAEDIYDAVRLLLSLLGIVLAKQAAAVMRKESYALILTLQCLPPNPCWLFSSFPNTTSQTSISIISAMDREICFL